MSEPRILGVYPSFIENYAWLFRVLDGFQIDLLSEGLHQSSVLSLDLPKNINAVFYPKPFGHPALRHITKFFYFLSRFPKFLSRRYKVVIFWGPPHYLGAVFSPLFRLFGVRTVSHTIDDLAEEAFVYVKRPWLRWARYFFVRFFDAIFISSLNLVTVGSHHLKKVYSRFNKNIMIVPTSMNVERILKIKSSPQKNPTIVHFGQLLEHRGVFLLADAFKHVRKVFPNARLVFIGKGPAYDELSKYVKDEKGIIVAGFLDYEKAISMVKGSDVGVIPFYKKYKVNFSGSPGKFFEYVACGLPVVGTNAGEHTYYIKQYKVGLICEDNPRDLAEAIIRILKNRKLREQFKRNSIKHAMAVHFENLFEPFREKIEQLASN